MSPRLSAFALAAGLIAAQLGCNSCGDRPGWCTSRARTQSAAVPVGRSSGCFDAVTGQPVPCPPEAPGAFAPSPYPIPGAPGQRFDELPMPSPADMIRPPAVPSTAPPPPPGEASLPYPISPGVPVKAGPNK
jgi:hypothetical protein